MVLQNPSDWIILRRGVCCVVINTHWTTDEQDITLIINQGVYEEKFGQRLCVSLFAVKRLPVIEDSLFVTDH